MRSLRVSQLSKCYGGLSALQGVSLETRVGERRAVIGPNGAGKTTLLALISGELDPTEGAVYIGGKNATLMPPHSRTNLGLGYVFQNSSLFDSLTVIENMRIAVQRHHRITRHIFRSASSFDAVTDAALTMLHLVGLASVQNYVAMHLGYGQQRVLDVALALAVEPQVLLLDEPTAGMSPSETKNMVDLISALPRTLTILMVEHDMDVVFRLADRITVLQYGKVISEGTPEEVRADPTVQSNYLGTQNTGGSVS